MSDKIEPTPPHQRLPDIILCFGVLAKPAGMPGMTIREETEAMEMAVALEVMREAGQKWLRL